MTMEGFIEFIVYGFLSIYTRDMTKNGEILGLIFAFICISLAVFLIIALIWSIIFKDEK
jgi:predicted permease